MNNGCDERWKNNTSYGNILLACVDAQNALCISLMHPSSLPHTVL